MLVGRQSEWKELADASIDARCDRENRSPLSIAEVSSSHSQGQLQQEKLFKSESLASRLGRGEILGKVDLFDRFLDVRKAMVFAEVFGNQLDKQSRVTVDDLAEQRTEMVAAKIFRQRIHGHDGQSRTRGRVVERLHTRIVHLPVIAIPARFAAEGDSLTIAESPGRRGLIEPHPFQNLPSAIAENDAHHGSSIVESSAVDFDDLALHRLRFAAGQVGDGANIGQIFVGSRKVKQQILDGAQPEPRELIQPR
jgi:hypothetical protein